MKRFSAFAFLLLLTCLMTNLQDSLCADDARVKATDVYQEKTLTVASGPHQGQAVRYRLMPPAKVEEGKSYPLVVFLHGAGERGTDNEAQLKYLPEQMAQPTWREQFPCYVLAPQCRPNARWVETDWALKEPHTQPETPGDQMQILMQMLEATLETVPIDRSRIYLTGLSMGGFGTWDLAMRKPDLFAAVAPVCGGADDAKVAVLKNVPIWVTHGDADNVVAVQRSRGPVAVLREAGSPVVYMELPGVAHNSWTPAYSDNDGLVPWLFRQQKK